MYQSPTSSFKIEPNNVVYEANRVPRSRSHLEPTPKLCYKLVVLRKLPGEGKVCNDIPLSGYHCKYVQDGRCQKVASNEQDIAFEKDVSTFSESFNVDLEFAGGSRRDRLSPFEKPKPAGQYKFGALISDEEYTLALKVFNASSPKYEELECLELSKYFNVERTTVQALDKEGDDIIKPEPSRLWEDKASVIVNGQQITLHVTGNFVQRMFVNKGKLGKHNYNFFNEAKETISLVARVYSELYPKPIHEQSRKELEYWSGNNQLQDVPAPMYSNTADYFGASRQNGFMASPAPQLPPDNASCYVYQGNRDGAFTSNSSPPFNVFEQHNKISQAGCIDMRPDSPGSYYSPSSPSYDNSSDDMDIADSILDQAKFDTPMDIFCDIGSESFKSEVNATYENFLQVLAQPTYAY